MVVVLLGSGSTARAVILKYCGFEFVQRPTNAKEDLPKGDYKTPEEYCDATCLLKAQSCLECAGYDFAIYADTIVISPDGRIMEKPNSHREAVEMLMAHAVNTYADVYTSVIVRGRDGTMMQKGSKSRIHFRQYQKQEVEEYLKNDDNLRECMTGSGALTVMGTGARWLTRVDGCFYNSAGLSPAVLFGIIDAWDGMGV